MCGLVFAPIRDKANEKLTERNDYDRRFAPLYRWTSEKPMDWFDILLLVGIAAGIWQLIKSSLWYLEIRKISHK